MGRQRRVKIVATLGPATDGEEMLEALLAAGVDVARLNFSHGTHDQHAGRIRRVRAAARKLGRSVAIMQDLQGPKIRTGRLVAGQPIQLRRDDELVITTVPTEGTAARVSTTYPGLPADCRPGDTLLVDDGRIRLEVIECTADQVRARVRHGGMLGEHKGINLPGVVVSAPAFTEKDADDLAFGLAEGVDFVAISFVREAADLELARSVMEKCGRSVPLISKLEKPQAVQHLDAIVAASDGVMVARGDLGVELAPEEVPPLQKSIIRSANRRGVPVITATQMLESMIGGPTPTRAEASDVANSVWDGTDAVMLSAETAMGAFPVEAVTMMHRIVQRAEAVVSQHDQLHRRPIAAFTRTGRTAHILSQDRPRVPIYAFTPRESVYHHLALWWGVSPIMGITRSAEDPDNSEALIAEIEETLLATGAVRRNDLVVVVGPLPFRQGTHTNFIKLHTIGHR